jgi:hypothetical protein
MNPDVETAPSSVWLDPEEHKPSRGKKMLLLNKGGVAVLGQWDDEFLAWAPLPKIPTHIKEKLL